MAKAANKPRKKGGKYKMPEPLPNGLILEDIGKKKWKLGPSIGKGGFGEIYSAQSADTQKKSNNHPYVIKIEPHENGPLFVEMHFYMRNAKPADIEAFIAERKLSGLGMPKYLGSGSHEYKGEKYRFVVMERFGDDIWKLFLENKRRFPAETVFKLGVQILDVLEYIHSKGYIHADIKGTNILLGLGREYQNQVYLLDFGLCAHYNSTYKPNPKTAHNGTIEYLSRDAHLGVQSRRGDLEILGYNLTEWFGCVLPWEKLIKDPVAVQKSKETHMNNLPEFFKACFGKEDPPTALVDYMKYVTTLSFETNPDYKKLRKILVSGLEKAGGSLKSALKFKSTAATPVKRRATSASPEKQNKKLELSEDEVLDKKRGGKKIKVDDEDINENQTKKKRGRKAKASSTNLEDDSDEDHRVNGKQNTDKNGAVVSDSEEESPKVTKKKTGTKTKEPKDEVDLDDSSAGFTEEMRRIKDKIKEKKLPKTRKVTDAAASGRTMRKRAIVNYNDD